MDFRFSIADRGLRKGEFVPKSKIKTRKSEFGQSMAWAAVFLAFVVPFISIDYR